MKSTKAPPSDARSRRRHSRTIASANSGGAETGSGIARGRYSRACLRKSKGDPSATSTAAVIPSRRRRCVNDPAAVIVAEVKTMLRRPSKSLSLRIGAISTGVTRSVAPLGPTGGASIQ